MALVCTHTVTTELPDSRAQGKEQKMQMNFGMLHDKAECGIELLGVKQRDKDRPSKRPMLQT
jgi:hypothetical protein